MGFCPERFNHCHCLYQDLPLTSICRLAPKLRDAPLDFPAKRSIRTGSRIIKLIIPEAGRGFLIASPYWIANDIWVTFKLKIDKRKLSTEALNNLKGQIVQKRMWCPYIRPSTGWMMSCKPTRDGIGYQEHRGFETIRPIQLPRPL